MLLQTKNRKNAVAQRSLCSALLFVRSCVGPVFFLMTLRLLYRNLFRRRFRLWITATKIEADLTHSARMILFGHYSSSLPHRRTRNSYERSRTKTAPQGSARGVTQQICMSFYGRRPNNGVSGILFSRMRHCISFAVRGRNGSSRIAIR